MPKGEDSPDEPYGRGAERGTSGNYRLAEDRGCETGRTLSIRATDVIGQLTPRSSLDFGTGNGKCHV